MFSFPCTGCGLCCQKAGKSVLIARQLQQEGNTSAYVAEIAAFPYSFDRNGRCEKLSPDDKCAVYEQRPDICKVDVSYQKHYQNEHTWADYVQLSAAICNKLMEEAGKDVSYRIIL